MAKTLNQNLRDEFFEILNEDDFSEIIKSKKLDIEIIKKSFDILLENKQGDDEKSLIDTGRAKFELNIINTLKSK